VDEESALLHNVVDSGNETAPAGSDTMLTKEALALGHYVAVCKLPGHCQRGMWLDLTVVP
jgi:uncharacterized cupredoxin-like copper-binding protein